jgi:hypothetical protein
MNEPFTKNESPYIRMRNKEEEIKEIKEERESARAPVRSFEKSENEFVSQYHTVYPNRFLSIHQQEMITRRIRDGTIWQKALDFWTGNGYRAESVEKICNKYDELEKQNGISQGHQPTGMGYRTAGEKRGDERVAFRQKIAELRNAGQNGTGQADRGLLGNGNGTGT